MCDTFKVPTLRLKEVRTVEALMPFEKSESKEAI